MTRTIALAALVATAAVVAAATAGAQHQYGDHRPIVVAKTDADGRSDLQTRLAARERSLDVRAEAQGRPGWNAIVEWTEIGIGFVIGTVLSSGVFMIAGRSMSRGLVHR